MLYATFAIRAPSSLAKIGPGFDVTGLALSLYLELRLHRPLEDVVRPPAQFQSQLRGRWRRQPAPRPPGKPHRPRRLLCPPPPRPARLPVETHVHVINPIPLGRGLRSSGAAVVAGVMLGGEAGGLHHLADERLFDFCFMIERHPDNIGATLFGGVVGTYLKPLSPEDVARVEIPLSGVIPDPQPAGTEDTGKQPPEPPVEIGHHIRFPWAKDIKAVAIVPEFEVPIAPPRGVLPETYPRQDIIFKLQRIALLPVAFGQSPPDPDLIYLAMQDKLHQQYRMGLVPGLTGGLLGVCLFGSGPTILALAMDSFEEIAERIIGLFRKQDITCKWLPLEPAEGTKVIR
ncbi:GHMP kinase [Microdochium trichocladiopsis]|uniref:GHMP kinase n=1 Tax=Microdochium trichocladiopsis TaxID=1682393 RepID=A0A9P8XXV8_9PEZI|nr:GHMP kinase [Microdochium trichocladiopsis]KAH7024828.1 GHMP kinase [Microdochium trichocladiopsis]